MRYHKMLLDIIEYAYNQAHDSCICVCPSAVPDWDDNKITDDMAERQLEALRIIRRYIKNHNDGLFTTEVTTNYIPGEDITIVWQHMYIDDEPVQRTVVGWYHGEPDYDSTKHYSESSLMAQYDF